MRALTALALCAALAAAGPSVAVAQTYDARVQTVDYTPDGVTLIRAALGYQIMVEFSPAERIENVSIGDALGWQVTPNRRANILFLKPVDGSATNMTVVTDSRRYLFDLRMRAKGSKTPPPYAVRFVYPTPATAILIPTPEPEPQLVNAAYAISGSPESAPLRVFDDGVMTYFEWPPQGAIPAIFAVAPDGSESIVNYTVRGRFIVVQQLAGRFSLRHSKQVATVTNSAYPMQVSARRPR